MKHQSEEETAMHHDLKISPENFRQLQHGERAFDIRNNDRDFKAQDVVTLHEWKSESPPDDHNGLGHFTGLKLHRVINRVFHDMPGLAPGYVAISYRMPIQGEQK